MTVSSERNKRRRKKKKLSAEGARQSPVRNICVNWREVRANGTQRAIKWILVCFCFQAQEEAGETVIDADRGISKRDRTASPNEEAVQKLPKKKKRQDRKSVRFLNLRANGTQRALKRVLIVSFMSPGGRGSWRNVHPSSPRHFQ